MEWCDWVLKCCWGCFCGVVLWFWGFFYHSCEVIILQQITPKTTKASIETCQRKKKNPTYQWGFFVRFCQCLEQMPQSKAHHATVSVSACHQSCSTSTLLGPPGAGKNHCRTKLGFVTAGSRDQLCHGHGVLPIICSCEEQKESPSPSDKQQVRQSLWLWAPVAAADHERQQQTLQTSWGTFCLHPVECEKGWEMPLSNSDIVGHDVYWR